MWKVCVLFLLSLVNLKVWGQVSLTNASPSAIINFSNTTPSGVGTNPTSAFTGAGFEPNPATAGKLNSNAWATTGFSDFTLAFGGTITTGDHARGSTASAVTTGGVYAYTGTPATVLNPTLMIQPDVGNFAPGTLTLRIQNNGATNITAVDVSYNLYVNNDGGKSNSFNFSYSTNDIFYISLSPVLDFNSAAAADGLGWVLVGPAPSRSTTLLFNITPIPPGGYFYIRWTGADAGGSGSMDELGLDDINLTATFSSTANDYFRSSATGNWGSTGTWESSADNITFFPATLTPDNNAKTILIQNGHTVTIAANVSADELIIQSGGTLNHTNAVVFTVNDGAGTDMTVNGTYVLNGTQPSGTGTVSIQSGGKVRVDANNPPGDADKFAYGNANATFLTGSVYEWANTTIPDWDGRTYFTNGENTTFRFSQPPSGSLGGPTNPTLIYGVLEANAPIFIQGSGTKTFVNGILGTGTTDASGSNGNIIINGGTAVLGGGALITAGLPQVLQINNSAVAMTSNKMVDGNITLSNGNVTLGSFNLTVSGNITGGSAASHIITNGTGMLTLQNVGATPKAFPIGNVGYNPVYISHAGVNTDFSARVEVGINPTIAFPTYGVNRTWNILASSPTPNVVVGFQYEAADLNGGLLVTDNLEALHFSGFAWNIILNNIVPSGAGPYVATTTASLTIPATSLPFALGKTGGWILPLDCIVSCRSRKVGNTGIISWDINSCAEVNSFEVQRSIDGGVFQTVATITTSAQLDYSYSDATLAKGTNLYRIKVNRSSGAIKYSNTVAIINDTKGILITALSPNPVNDMATLIINAAKAGTANFSIYDINGRLVNQWQTNITEGSNIITVSAKGLSGGIYHLAANAGDSKTVIRFVKQ